jgi:hypothetical protein
MKFKNPIQIEAIESQKPAHPSLFTLLILPLGIMTGYVTVTLAYLFSKEGISVEKVAALVAAVLLPHIFKFIWAPAVGCLLGGWICDRINRQSAYLLFGLAGAFCAVGMAYSSKTEFMYIIWTSVYAVTVGLSYAGFSAFALEAIGKGAAATKYNIYAALSNSPIYLMIYIEGWAHLRWGPKGMLNIEAAFAVLAIILFLLLQTLMKERKHLALKISQFPDQNLVLEGDNSWKN